MKGSAKVAVVSVVLSCEVTANPTRTSAVIATFTVDRMIHAVPSAEIGATIVLPVRTCRSQYSVAAPHGPGVKLVADPGVARLAGPGRCRL